MSRKVGRKRRGIVLVAVLKTRRDREILLTQGWYRIPAAHIPRRKFRYIAFYQPEAFGRSGKRIEYHARVRQTRVQTRQELLSEERDHPRASQDYYRVSVDQIKRLPCPIRNTTPRRVSFGFTTLKKMRTAKNILQLYAVAETEEMLARELKRRKIKFQAQFWVTGEGKRYRLDFAVPGARGKIAIECDNRKAHLSKAQLRHDAEKDEFLRSRGWRVVRFGEEEIVENVRDCGMHIQRMIEEPQ